MTANTRNIFVTTFIAMLCINLTGCDLVKKVMDQVKPAEQKSENVSSPSVKKEDNAAISANVIAQVGSWTMTREQFDQRLNMLKEGLPNFDPNKSGVKEQVLNELIRQELLVQDAQQKKIGEKREIAEAVDDFRRTLLVQELANTLTKDVVATETDARQYYEANKAQMIDPVKWKVREIVVSDEATAKNILVQVLQGGDFGEIAKAQSKAKTAAKGGLLPIFVRAPFAAMEAQLASLDVGGTSSVFKGPEGFYIVHVDKKEGGKPLNFDEIKKDLISGLTLQKQQKAVLDHIDSLAARTKVVVNKEALEGLGKK